MTLFIDRAKCRICCSIEVMLTFSGFQYLNLKQCILQRMLCNINGSMYLVFIYDDSNLKSVEIFL